jgi:hypothetical protein
LREVAILGSPVCPPVFDFSPENVGYLFDLKLCGYQGWIRFGLHSLQNSRVFPPWGSGFVLPELRKYPDFTPPMIGVQIKFGVFKIVIFF